MNHFKNHNMAWCPIRQGDNLDGICFSKQPDGKVIMEVCAANRARFEVGNRSLRRIQKLIADMIEYNNS